MFFVAHLDDNGWRMPADREQAVGVLRHYNLRSRTMPVSYDLAHSAHDYSYLNNLTLTSAPYAQNLLDLVELFSDVRVV